MTTLVQPIPVPPPPAKLPVQVVVLPAESIYKTDPAKTHMLVSVYVNYKAFFLGLPADGGIALPPTNVYLRVQASDETPVRVDICARVISLNGAEHGFGTMVLGMGGIPLAKDGFILEAFGTFSEWAVPPKSGVPIYPDKANVAMVRLEAWVDGRVAGSTMISYQLEPMPRKTP